MTRRQVSQPELQALTNIATAIAICAWTLTPGLLAIPAAVLTYYATATGAAKAFRWDTAHTLAGSHHILRTQAATLIRAVAWLLQALTTAVLLGLAEAHRRTLPNPNS